MAKKESIFSNLKKRVDGLMNDNGSEDIKRLERRYKLTMEKETKKKLINKKDNTDTIVEKIHGVNEKNKDLVSKIPTNDLNRISQDIADRNFVRDKIIELFPDMELSAEIAVSSTLSPMDISTKPSFEIATDYAKLPSHVTAQLDEIMKDDLISYYKLDSKLYTMVYESLISRGAYCEMLIPESSAKNAVRKYIDEMNSAGDYDKLTVEGLITSLPTDKELLYNTTKELSGLTLTNESEKTIVNKFITKFDDLINVTTDPKSMLIKDELLATQEAERVSRGDKVTIDKKELLSDVFDIITDNISKTNKVTAMSELNVGNKEEDNRPIILKLPVESVIPLYLKNDPSDHLGYIVLTDETGSPVSHVSNDVEMGLETEEEEVDKRTLMVEVLRTATINVQTDNRNATTINNIENVATQLVASKIERLVLKDGIHSLIDEKSLDLVYRAVLQKIRANEKTNFLYVDKERLNYIAFKYRANGTGESILDGMVQLASMRATNMVAKQNAELRNSIPNEHFEVILPEDDPDAPKTMKAIMSSIMENNKFKSPKGLIDIQDINKWITNSGKTFNFTHPALPKIEIDRSDRTTNIVIPTEETENRLRKQSIMKFGLTPEMVDSSYDPEFATSVVANHSLLGKRVLNRQGILEELLSVYSYNAVMADGRLYRKLLDNLKSNLKDIKKFIGTIGLNVISDNGIKDDELLVYLVEEYSSIVGIHLPKPYSDNNSLADEFEKYRSYVDDYIEDFISSDILPPELIGDLSDDVDAFSKAIRNSLLRDWCNVNGYMTELSNLFNSKEDNSVGFKLLEEYQINKDKMTEGLLEFMKNNKRKIKKDNKKYNKIKSEEDDPEDTPPDDGGSNPDDDTPPDDSGDGLDDNTPPDDSGDMDDGEEPPTDDTPLDDGESDPLEEQSNKPNLSVGNGLTVEDDSYSLLSSFLNKNDNMELTTESVMTTEEFLSSNKIDPRKKEEFLELSKEYLKNNKEVNFMVKQIVEVFDSSEKIHQLFSLEMKDIIEVLLKHGIATKGFMDVEAMNKMVKEYYGVSLPSIKNEIYNTMFEPKFKTIDNMRLDLINKEESLIKHDYNSKYGLAKYDGFKLVRVKDVEDRFDSMPNDIKHSEIINVIHKGILAEWKTFEIKKYISSINGFEKSSSLDVNKLIKTDNQQYNNLMAGIAVKSDELENDVSTFFKSIFDNISKNKYVNDDNAALYSEALVRAYYSIDKRVFGAHPEHYFRFKDGKRVVMGKDALGNNIYLLASLKNQPIDKQVIVDKKDIDYKNYKWTSVELANRKGIVQSIADGNTYKTRINFTTVETLPERTYNECTEEANSKIVDPTLLLSVIEENNSTTAEYTKDRLKALLFTSEEDLEDVNNITVDKLRIALNKVRDRETRNIASEAFDYMFEDWRGSANVRKANAKKSDFFKIRNVDYVENHENYKEEKFRGLFKPKTEFISYEDELRRQGRLVNDNNIAKLLEVQVNKLMKSKPTDFDFVSYLKRLGREHSDDYKPEDVKNYLKLFKEDLSQREVELIRGSLATTVIEKLQKVRDDFFSNYHGYLKDKNEYIDYMVSETFGGTTEWDSKHSDSATRELKKIKDKVDKVAKFDKAVVSLIENTIPANNVNMSLLSGREIPNSLKNVSANMYMVIAKQIDGKYDNEVFNKYKGAKLLENCDVSIFNAKEYDRLKADGAMGYIMSGDDYIDITDGVIPANNNVPNEQYTFESFINAEDTVKNIIMANNKFSYDSIDNDIPLVDSELPNGDTYHEQLKNKLEVKEIGTDRDGTPIDVILNRVTNYKKAVQADNIIRLNDIKERKVNGIISIDEVNDKIVDVVYGSNLILKDIRTIIEHVERYKNMFDKSPDYLTEEVAKLYNKYNGVSPVDYVGIDRKTIENLLSKNSVSTTLDINDVLYKYTELAYETDISNSDIDEMVLYFISKGFVLSNEVTQENAMIAYKELKEL